jgi:threonine dehydrogenase-like Zn-dependent dehydrogenase
MASNRWRRLSGSLQGGSAVHRLSQDAGANGRDIDHGVILKIVATNICGSNQHMVRGRTTAPTGLVLGREITGEVIKKGSDVETPQRSRH